VCRLLGRGKWLVAFLLILVVLGPFGRTILAHGNEVWREYSYLGGMDAIALGCLTAIAGSRIKISRRAIGVLAGLGTVLVLFILGLSNQAEAWGLERSGLDMTVLAIGSCMVITAAAETRWKSPRVVLPLISLGRRSYEVYLTHMFVVFAAFGLFKAAGLSLAAVPALFISVILISGLLGGLVARFYSEPMNRRIRQRFGDGPETLGSAVQS
jgi:peptidoglycan/LPS O-acetylase OafA/YrhL